MALTIWPKLGQNVKGIISDHLRKTACRNLFWFIHKVPKSAENGSFLTFFSKMTCPIWLKLGQNVKGFISKHLQETAGQNLFSFIQKVPKRVILGGFLDFSQKIE